ncbi:MAG: hypothetical protein JO136_07390 [Hyphomicrobiales bacterium]|nr:hypothetical protein [Hyphomicrobiales bacterium]MBV9909098.1 hypothetical protein [Hyphomicrobiales bacterium]
MSFGASLAGLPSLVMRWVGWRIDMVCGNRRDEDIDFMVTRRRLERRER